MHKLSDRTLRVHWIVLLAAVLSYLGLFVVYYPGLSAVDDEVGFVNQAVILSKGALTAESAGIGGYGEVNGHATPWRNPGRSMLIVPLIVLLGLHSIFISGALIHAAMTFAAALVHDTLGQSPLWALLVLWHPTLSIYSRTIMGDAPAGLFLLLAVLAILRFDRGWLWAGLFLGVAVWMRYHVALVVPFFVLAIWQNTLRLRGGRADAIKCLAAAAVVMAPVPVYNLAQFGRIFGRYAPGDQGLLGANFFLPNLGFYALALMVIWPGMLLSLLHRSRVSAYARAICLPVLAFFCFYFFHDSGTSFLQTEILGLRLLQCVLPVWIVTYGVFLSETSVPLLRARIGPAAFAGAAAAVALVLLLSQWYAFSVHQRYLLALERTRNDVARRIPSGSVILSNVMLHKLFAIADPSLPKYEWIEYDLEHTFSPPKGHWFLAYLPRRPGDDRSDRIADYVAAHDLARVNTDSKELLVFETRHVEADQQGVHENQ
jgi:hypothetical protein